MGAEAGLRPVLAADAAAAAVPCATALDGFARPPAALPARHLRRLGLGILVALRRQEDAGAVPAPAGGG